MLYFLPIGVGRIVGIWTPTPEYPDGIIYTGKYKVIKKNTNNLYFVQNLVLYSPVTFKKIVSLKREDEYIIDKNNVCHCIVRIGNKITRKGYVTNITDKKLAYFLSGSIFAEDKHYRSMGYTWYKYSNEMRESKYTIYDTLNKKLMIYNKITYE